PGPEPLLGARLLHTDRQWTHERPRLRRHRRGQPDQAQEVVERPDHVLTARDESGHHHGGSRAPRCGEWIPEGGWSRRPRHSEVISGVCRGELEREVKRHLRAERDGENVAELSTSSGQHREGGSKERGDREERRERRSGGAAGDVTEQGERAAADRERDTSPGTE